MIERRYSVALQHGAEGYGAWAPGLPGCDSPDAARQSGTDAGKSYRLGCAKPGDPYPTPRRA